MYECGLVEDANVVSVAETGDLEESPQSSGHADKNSNAELEKEFDETLEGNPKHSKITNKGKTPTIKKRMDQPTILWSFWKRVKAEIICFFKSLSKKEAEGN